MAEWWMGEGCEESGGGEKVDIKNPRNKKKKKKQTPRVQDVCQCQECEEPKLANQTFLIDLNDKWD